MCYRTDTTDIGDSLLLKRKTLVSNGGVQLLVDHNVVNKQLEVAGRSGCWSKCWFVVLGIMTELSEKWGVNVVLALARAFICSVDDITLRADSKRAPGFRILPRLEGHRSYLHNP